MLGWCSIASIKTSIKLIFTLNIVQVKIFLIQDLQQLQFAIPLGSIVFRKMQVEAQKKIVTSSGTTAVVGRNDETEVT